jgi:hypothetical protein
MYDLKKLAHDIGKTVHPSLQAILEGVHNESLADFHREVMAELARGSDRHKQEIARIERGFKETLDRLHQQHRVELDQARRSSKHNARSGIHDVHIAYSGQVPTVLDGVNQPLLRIRWQEGQPMGEGESPVPSGWVLDDDQAGTWLDAVNTRALSV